MGRFPHISYEQMARGGMNEQKISYYYTNFSISDIINKFNPEVKYDRTNNGRKAGI